jgi:Flp pilus assembly pilin Flp
MKATKSMIERAKRSLLGRTVCRLAGDQKGAVMMEYVIVAVLIAAACVVAVAMFGKTIVGMFDSAAKGSTGDHSGAKTTQDATRDTQDTDAKAAGGYHDSMHK